MFETRMSIVTIRVLREAEDYYLYADFTENPGNMCLGDVAASCSRSVARVQPTRSSLSVFWHIRTHTRIHAQEQTP